MRILDIKTFVALARNRHFGRTAEELNTTQPAISSRLAAIEAELESRLINRGDGSFALTADGERVLQSFEAILGDIDRLRGTLQGDAVPALEPLRIGAIDSVSSTWMPHLIDSLHRSFPNLKIELTVDGTKHLVQGMTKGEFDVIFSLHPVLDDGFRSFTSCVLQMVWAGSPKLIDPDRTYSVAELASLPIISFPKNSPPYQMIAPYFHDEQALASKLTSCNSLYAIINLIIDGFGVGAIPAVTIRRELSMGLLHQVQVSKRFPPMHIVASYQASTHQDFIRKVISQARISAARFCASVEPDMAWID
ncbi:LysR family transcriptional regulator [Nitratireductor sp. L1-7-SE]|uniref:LysR family transcriptional regulator n=1 Tax=Nitratireductor rhodophyticola TaxID=2854036 RepID=A0ABS7RD15_9HYPH|nr:LysR family transcriptional regulator [Nitratireductor rhodophyticola]MBY8918295.1 LysR family transcriptional regulator [Nitratireductor rhodophyticola]MBY8920896.1 LysR family transcriptional regulator [Nitratireductor rhodophyticola]